MKKCPFCAEEIQEDAVKCRHCGEWLTGKPLQHRLIAFKDYFQTFYNKTYTLFNGYWKYTNKKIETYKNREPNGIGGWLLIFIINVFLSGIILIIENGYLINSIIANKYDYATLFYLGISVGVFAIITGCCLSLKFRNSVICAKTLLIFTIFYIILKSGLLLISFKQLVSTIIAIIVWYVYLDKSKRVGNTFYPSIDKMMITVRSDNESHKII